MPNPPPLADLQRWLRWVFTEPAGVDRALAGRPSPLSRRAEPRPRRFSAVADAPPLPPAERLQIYANAYFERLHDVLAADYPALRRALGADDFRRLAAEYLAANPSRSPNVEDVGEKLPAFLARRKKGWPADLARLERGVLEAVFAARLPPLDAADLAAAPPDRWPRARFTLDPTVRFVESGWAVGELWEKRLSAAPARPPARKKCLFVVFRGDGWPRVRVLERAEGDVLRRLARGEPLGRAIGGLRRLGGRPESVRDWFGRWMEEGLVKRVNFGGGTRSLTASQRGK